MDSNKLIHDTLPTLAMVGILASLFTTITTAPWSACAAMLFIIPVQTVINKSLLKLPSEYNQAIKHLSDEEAKQKPTKKDVIFVLLAIGAIILPLPIAYFFADFNLAQDITVNAIYGAAVGFVAFKIMFVQVAKAMLP